MIITREQFSNPNYRSKAEYPYSYDPITIFSKRAQRKGDHAAYSDRMYQWDADKFNKTAYAIWNNMGQYFEHRTPTDIERWLCLYFDRPVELIHIEEHCNQATGYPVWFFVYADR